MAYSQGTKIDETSLKSALVDLIYPVGSIYMSVTNASPQSFLGGTWEAISGKFLLASDSTYTAGSTGGSVSHTHTTASHTLTKSEMPSHDHSASSNLVPNHSHTRGTMEITGSITNALADQASGSGAFVTNGSRSGFNSGGYGWKSLTFTASNSWTGSTSAAGQHSHDITVNSTGGGGAHSHGDTGSSSNLPPYLSVYMWKRTA